MMKLPLQYEANMSSFLEKIEATLAEFGLVTTASVEINRAARVSVCQTR